jgi:TolB protein
VRAIVLFRAFLTLYFTLVFNIAPGHAQTDLSVRGANKLYPIALPRLCLQGGSDEIAREIVDAMTRSLDVSGYFEVLNSNSFIESPGNCKIKEGFAYSDWSVIGAEGLVKGVINSDGGRSFRAQLYLHDVPKQRTVLGKEYGGDKTFARQIGQKFANEIMKFFTGIPGVFGSQIVFSSKIGRFKELFIMDMDGTNIKQLTQDRGLAMSAGWHPDGKRLVYTSYRNRVPDIFRFDLDRGSFAQLSRGIALELGAEYSNDGQEIVLSRTVNGESDIVLASADGTVLKALTSRNGAIDVSPSWSPDNRRVAFCSNRGGGPQIYTMNRDGSGAKRISYVTSDYCTSPAWSPMGDKIAFVCRADRGFQMFVANSDGSQPLQLTSVGSSEDPSWAPNGQYIAYSSTFGYGGRYQIAIMRPDGTGVRQLTFRQFDDTQPAWGPVPQDLRVN